MSLNKWFLIYFYSAHWSSMNNENIYNSGDLMWMSHQDWLEVLTLNNCLFTNLYLDNRAYFLKAHGWAFNFVQVSLIKKIKGNFEKVWVEENDPVKSSDGPWKIMLDQRDCPSRSQSCCLRSIELCPDMLILSKNYAQPRVLIACL